MDIDLPEKDGIEVSREIMDIDPEIFMIYATGYSKYMSKAFELYAFDYLLKPYKIERIKETIEKIRQLVELRSQASAKQAVNISPGPITKKTPIKIDRRLVFLIRSSL